MDKTELVGLNISNLTSLWRLVSEPFDGYYNRKEFTYYDVANSDWPNRLWFHNVMNSSSFAKADDHYFKKAGKVKLTSFDGTEESGSELLEKHNFQLASEQTGMALELDVSFELSVRLFLKEATSLEDAKLWCYLFERAFQYKVNYTQVLLGLDKTTFYLISDTGGNDIGTIILHSDRKDVIGIHSMGIIPTARRKGYAMDLMKTVLHLSKSNAFAYVTLQASEMAVPLYKKLGFQEQFSMKNYQQNKI